MGHFIVTSVWIIVMGLCGIFASVFMKAQDYNRGNDETTLRTALGKFITHEWPSYMLSVTILAVLALSHDEWLKWLSGSKYTADSIFHEIGGLVKIASFAVMFIIQHGIYKFWLGRLTK